MAYTWVSMCAHLCMLFSETHIYSWWKCRYIYILWPYEANTLVHETSSPLVSVARQIERSRAKKFFFSQCQCFFFQQITVLDCHIHKHTQIIMCSLTNFGISLSSFKHYSHKPFSVWMPNVISISLITWTCGTCFAHPFFLNRFIDFDILTIYSQNMIQYSATRKMM